MNAQQLKNAILQEAIEGRLVPQDPNDEPASVLLDKIRKEKAKLVKEGKLKKKDLDEFPVFDDEIPFDIPDNWKWCKLGTIAAVLGGKRIPAGRKLSIENTGHIYIRVSDMKGNSVSTDNLQYVPEDIFPSISKYIINKEDVYITVAGTIGKIGKIPSELDGANLTENADRLVFSHLNQDWLIKCLESNVVQAQITGVITKVGQPKLAILRIQTLLIPLPPLAEQKRIVAKIEELLPKVEEYGKAQEALDKLNEELPERLKKSILQEAIEGRLVPQDPNDEPASVLLDKIRMEKARLVKEGKLKKKDLVEVPIEEDEIPFKIPESWEWVRHNDLFDISGGSQPPKSDFSLEEKEGYIRLYQIRDYGEKPSPVYIPISKASKITQKGDILLARYGGSLGKVFIAEDGAYNVAMAKVEYLFNKSLIDHDYLYYYYNCSLYQDLVKGNNRSAQGGFNKEDLGSLLFPLPPLSEQHRIVEKIEQLMKEIDKLKV